MASSQAIKQSSRDLSLSTKKTRKQELLAQMDRVVPWAALVDLIAPYSEGKNGRPPFALETVLRIHCMQQWFTHKQGLMVSARRITGNPRDGHTLAA